jgi:hypothetical protein
MAVGSGARVLLCISAKTGIGAAGGEQAQIRPDDRLKRPASSYVSLRIPHLRRTVGLGTSSCPESGLLEDVH